MVSARRVAICSFPGESTKIHKLAWRKIPRIDCCLDLVRFLVNPNDTRITRGARPALPVIVFRSRWVIWCSVAWTRRSNSLRPTYRILPLWFSLSPTYQLTYQLTDMVIFPRRWLSLKTGQGREKMYFLISSCVTHCALPATPGLEIKKSKVEK